MTQKLANNCLNSSYYRILFSKSSAIACRAHRSIFISASDVTLVHTSAFRFEDARETDTAACQESKSCAAALNESARISFKADGKPLPRRFVDDDAARRLSHQLLEATPLPARTLLIPYSRRTGRRCPGVSSTVTQPDGVRISSTKHRHFRHERS